MNDSVIKTINVILALLALIGACICGVLMYYTSSLGKDKVPSAVTSTYTTQVTDPQTKETKAFLQANCYNNVIELLFNAYSGVDKQAIYARGFQLVTEGNKDTMYYYDKYNDAGYVTGHEYQWGDKMFLDINDELYAVALDGTYTTVDGWVFKREVEHQYTFTDLLNKMREIIKSSSHGTGDSVISLVDLGDFLHIYSVDEDGKVSGEPIGDRTLINSYFTVQVHYDNRDMVTAKQSMFGSVAGDSAYNKTGISEVDYWRANTEIVLTEVDFEAVGGVYALPVETLNKLSTDTVDIVVNMDISNLDIAGFDDFAFYGLQNLKSLHITSTLPKQVYMSEYLIDNIGCKITTNNVTLVHSMEVVR